MNATRDAFWLGRNRAKHTVRTNNSQAKRSVATGLRTIQKRCYNVKRKIITPWWSQFEASMSLLAISAIILQDSLSKSTVCKVSLQTLLV